MKLIYVAQLSVDNIDKNWRWSKYNQKEFLLSIMVADNWRILSLSILVIDNHKNFNRLLWFIMIDYSWVEFKIRQFCEHNFIKI